MLCASSRSTLRKEFSDLSFKEYNASDQDEVTLAQFLDSTRELTKSERHDAMTREELEAETVRKSIAEEQATLPHMLAGLVALKVQPHSSFTEAVERMLEEEGVAVVAKLAGPKGEELSGEVLTGVE